MRSPRTPLATLVVLVAFLGLTSSAHAETPATESAPASGAAAPVVPEIATDVARELKTNESTDVVIRLTEDLTENELREALPGVEIKTDTTGLPLASAEISKQDLTTLEESPVVEAVTPNWRFKINMAQSAPLVKADQANNLGWDGSNQAIAIVDTGVDSSHPFLNGRVVAEACFASESNTSARSCPNGQISQTGPGSGRPCRVDATTISLDCTHGTHVAGTAAGNGPDAGVAFSGIAPEAKIISVRVFSVDNGGAFVSYLDLIRGLQFVYNLRTTHNIAAINLSLGINLGSSRCDGVEGSGAATNINTVEGIFDRFVASGISPVVASGNESDADGMAFPACLSDSIAVGASSKQDQVASFSNASPNLALVAPGVNISSSTLGASWATHSGTSMAAPHVAGAIALLKQKRIQSTVRDIRAALMASPTRILDTRNNRYFKRLDALHAVNVVGTVVPPPTTAPPTTTTKEYDGYRIVDQWGCVTSFGDLDYFGDTCFVELNLPIVGIANTPTGRGYWLVATDGGIFSFGDAKFYGSTGAIKLNQPIVGMTASPTGRGYWFVAADGGIFSFGDAKFYGSTGAIKLNQPIVGMASTPSGRGYWLVATDGGIFSFGDAKFYGSTGAIKLNQPIVGMAVAAGGKGYWFVAADGGMFSYGSAKFYGSGVGKTHGGQIVGMATSYNGNGYWLVTDQGRVLSLGDANNHGYYTYSQGGFVGIG